MSDCCNSSHRHAPCPNNGQACHEITQTTLLHHLKEPWLYSALDQPHYFCDDADCEVIYFSDQGDIIDQLRLRIDVGQKQHHADRTVCYCFGVTEQQALQNAAIREFVIKATRDSKCNCEIRNPSGRCCLKTFPK